MNNRCGSGTGVFEVTDIFAEIDCGRQVRVVVYLDVADMGTSNVGVDASSAYW